MSGYGRGPPPRGGRAKSPRRGVGAAPPSSRSRDDSLAFGVASAYDSGGVAKSAAGGDDDMVNLSFHSGEGGGGGAGPPPEWDAFSAESAPSDYARFADAWEPPASGYDASGFADSGFGADLPPLDDMADGFGDLPELDIPDGPHVPDPVEIPDFDLDPAVAELQKNIQFIVLLHSQLIALHLETKKAFPALKPGESYLRELVGAEYEALLEDKAAYEAKIRELTQEVRTLKESHALVESLSAENEKLKQLTQTQSRKISPPKKGGRGGSAAKKKADAELRELLSQESRDYVLELEKQLHIYRSKVIMLVTEGEAAKRALFEVESRLKEAREDLTSARDDMQRFDASAAASASAEVSRLKSNLMEQQKKYLSEIDKLTHMLEESKKAASASKAAAASWSAEDSLRVEVRELQDQLGVQAAQHFQQQEEYEQKLKEQIETADKCRAKYESVKQHIKTLEAHQKEYMRVNEELKKQNDDFRTMIMAMKKKLDMYEAGGGPGPKSGADMDDGRARRAASVAGAGDADGSGAGAGAGGPDGAGGGGGAAGKMSQADFLKEQMAAYEAMSRSSRRLSGAAAKAPPAGVPGPPRDDGSGAAAAAGPMRPAAGGAAGKVGAAAAPPGGDPLNPVPVQEIWGRKMKTISQKGSKKRVLVEWHFVTSDNMPHTIVLQHTQDSKAKTRRMLWVDGAEKYNNKSSAASFRIEIDKDVVVITIELAGSQYQYRLTINGLSYSESFQLWKSKHKR